MGWNLLLLKRWKVVSLKEVYMPDDDTVEEVEENGILW